jgi:hypothetical protein
MRRRKKSSKPRLIAAFVIVMLLLLSIAAMADEDTEAPNGVPFDWSAFDKSVKEFNDAVDKAVQDALCNGPQPEAGEGQTVLRYERIDGKCVGKLE